MKSKDIYMILGIIAIIFLICGFFYNRHMFGSNHHYNNMHNYEIKT